MFNTIVEIYGPGGIVNYDAHFIIKALEAAGFICNVTNEHFDPDRKFDEIMSEKPKNINVKIVHVPWGG